MTKTIITYTNRKTGIEYKQFDSFTLPSGEVKVVLKQVDGVDIKELKETTLAKTYKKNVTEVEEPKTEETQLNRHQKLAKRQVKHAYNWTVGGYENRLSDEGTAMPSVEEMFNEVYSMALTEDCGDGFAGGAAKTELRLAGKQFILDQVAAMFRKDGYEVPSELTTITKKPKSNGPRKNIKGDITHVGENEVLVKAFTGMVIGAFEIVKQTKSTISVKSAKGILKFDKATGLQVNADKVQFANRIAL